MADNRDITVPTAGNKKLQPDILALGKTRDFQNSSSDFRNSDKFDMGLLSEKAKKIMDDTAFDRDSNGLLKLKTEKSNFQRGSDGLLRRSNEKESGLIKPMVSSAPTQKRDVVGDGPKSTLRPSTKNSSAFGRSTPFSGWFPMKFKSATYDSAVGGLGNPVTIPSFGLNPVAFTLGATTIQGLSWNGGFTNMDISQNGTSATTSYGQAENENA